MREILREQERSGLALRPVAEAAKIPYTTLSWWRSRLRRGAPLRFVPVRVPESVSRVEITVGDVVVRVADADETSVARLVRSIAESSRKPC